MKPRLCSLLFFFLTITAASARAPHLLKDLNTQGEGAFDQSLISEPGFTDIGNGSFFFIADLLSTGFELWKSDGTANGTFLVKDILPGKDGSSPENLVHVNGVLFFTANDGIHGRELWKSDGTEAGTILVKDIYDSPGDWPQFLFAFQNTLFFFAQDENGRPSLWKSNGTTEGTVVVKSELPYPVSALAVSDFIAELDGILFLGLGTELWKSDGTAEGTTLITTMEAFNISSMTAVDGKLFFATGDYVSGQELWKSDGTAGGTMMVKDIVPGDEDSKPENLTAMNGLLFFTAYTQPAGRELWKSDGTANGTVMVKDIYAGNTSSEPEELIAMNGALFFRAKDSTFNYELWKSNGTANGTVMVKDIYTGSYGSEPFSLCKVNGVLFFTATDSDSETAELWKSDGTANGTTLVKDINPSGHSMPYGLSKVGSLLYFVATNGVNGAELWRSDGTEGGTEQVKDINPATLGSEPSGFTGVQGRVFFFNQDSNRYRLWISQGTSESTLQLQETSRASYYGLMAHVGSNLLYAYNDRIVGQELWKSDGTTAGTALLKDIYPGQSSSDPLLVGTLDGLVLFWAYDGTQGLWKSDGTPEGTAWLKKLDTSRRSSAITKPANRIAAQSASLGNTLFFGANDGISGPEVWKSDGTASGTVLLKDICQGTCGTYPSNFVVVDSTLFFFHDDGVHGQELWKSDGTTEGTVIVKDIDPFGSALIKENIYGYSMQSVNGGGILFFGADDGVHGYELWKSDGTASGTVMVKDIYTPSGESSLLSSLTAVGNTVFFTARGDEDSYNDRELWKSDGTEEGTVRVKDIYPTADGSPPHNLFHANGLLYFAGNDGEHGVELWKSDGTEEGTVMVADMAPGDASSNPGNFFASGQRLYFSADDGLRGIEPWILSLSTAPVPARIEGLGFALLGLLLVWLVRLKKPGAKQPR